MDFKVRQDSYNPLLKRKEIFLQVDHDKRGTPSRVDVRKAIAAKYSTKPENVYVVNIETRTGTQNALCEVQVYDDADTAKSIVPKYIQIRNLPSEERKRVREQESKKEGAKPKAAKPLEEKRKQDLKPPGDQQKKS